MPTESQWEAKKSVIHNLYMTKNLKLQGNGGLIEHMKNNHGLNATKSQYETQLLKWGFRKYKTRADWTMIARKVQERKGIGKDSVVLINGQVVPGKKLKREVQRYGHDAPSHLSMSTDIDLAPSADIRVRTPELSSITAGSSRCSTSLMPPLSHMQLFQPTTLPKFWHAPLPIHSFTARQAPDLSQELDQSNVSNRSRINLAIPNGNHVLPASLCRLGSDFQRKDFGDMALRQVIRNASIGGIVPPELLSAHLGPNSTDLFGFADSQLIEIMVYFVSNNMVAIKDCTNVLNGFEAHQDHKLVRRLFSSQDITAESTVTNLMKYAFDAGDSRMAGTILSAQRTINSNLDPQKLMKKACQFQDLELVKIATELGAGIAAVSLTTVLKDIEDLAIERRPRDQPLGRIRLDINFLEYLLNHGSKICSHPKYRLRPSCLQFAMDIGSLNLVELLLSPARQCLECISLAVEHLPYIAHDGQHILRLFLEAGVNVDLAVAIRWRSVDAMRQILSRSPQFDILDLITSNAHPCDDLHFMLEALQLYYQTKKRNNEAHTQHPSVLLNGVADIEEPHLVPLLMTSILALPVKWLDKALVQFLKSAIKANSPEFAAKLIDHGATVDLDVITLLSAESHPELVKIIAQEIRPWHRRFEIGEWKYVQALTEFGDSSTLQKYLYSYPTASVKGLSHAIMAGKMDIVSCLLAAGVGQFYNPYDDKVTALEAAVRTRNLDLVDLLLKYGAPPCDNGALRAAVLVGCDVVETLLRSALRSPPYGKAGFGIPALQLAIEHKNATIVDLLLRNEVPTHQPYRDPIPGHLGYRSDRLTSPGPYGSYSEHIITALQTALQHDLSTDLRILKAVLASTPKDSLNNLPTLDTETSALEYAIRKQNAAAVNLLLEIGVDVDVKITRHHHSTPLNAAIENGDIILVQKLIEKGASVNSATHKVYGHTALQTAASCGYIPIARHLISCGADVNAAGSLHGGTALELAAQNCRVDMIHLLVEEGVQLIGNGNHQFERAKEMAIERSHLMVVKLLENLHKTQVESLGLGQATMLEPSGVISDIEQLGQTIWDANDVLLTSNNVGDEAPFESWYLPEMDGEFDIEQNDFLIGLTDLS